MDRMKMTLLLTTALVCLLGGMSGVVFAADPTNYLVAYPAVSINKCGNSPYNITQQAWQVDTCTYVIKYSIYGTPAISDWGFQLPIGNSGRSVTISGCVKDSSYSTEGGSGNTCTTDGPYGDWAAAKTLIKFDESGCGEVADFWVTATLTSLITNGTGTLALKGAQNCWVCDAVPYAFAAVSSCTAVSATPSPSASRTPSPSPSASATPSPSSSPSPSASATPSVSVSATASSSPNPSLTPTPSSSASATPSPSASPSSSASASATPSVSVSVTPSASPSSSPSASATPSASASPSRSPSASPSASSTPTPSAPPPPPPGGKTENPPAGAIAGGVIGGIAGVGAAGAAVAGAGYLVYRMMNRAAPPADLTSALDSPSSNSGGVNALFVDNSMMQPNPLFADSSV